jgi:hypothetical protein
VSGYDVSPDGTTVVFSAIDAENRSHLWLASLDFGFPPRRLVAPASEDEPRWDSAGYIYFRAAEGQLNFLYRIKPDGSERTKLLSGPILEFQGISPNGQWAITGQARDAGSAAQVLASPLGAGTPVAVCAGYCVAQWSPDGRTFSVFLDTKNGTKTIIAPVSQARVLPPLPPAGLATLAEMERVPGVRVLDSVVQQGPKPGLSAFIQQNVHRNLYRVALR